MRYAVTLFFFLLFAITGLLFFQYQTYSEKLESSEGEFDYTQEIEIVYRKNSLDIRQHFSNLPNREVKINWPSQAVSPDCFLESKNSCKRLDENKTKFTKSDIQKQSLSYIIPLKKGLSSEQLLRNIFVTLENGHATYSTLHITTDSDVKGNWLTGLPIVGEQKLKLVNYAMFSGTGPVTELYYQTGKVKLQEETNFISIYSNKPLSKSFKESLKKIKLLNDDHVVIIQSNKNKTQGERIIFLKDLSEKSIKNNVLLAQVKSQFDFGKSPGWLVEAFASFISDTDFDNQKAKQIVSNLENAMTKKELKQWKKELKKLKGKKINAKTLDDLLSKVFDKHTSYFSLNEGTSGVYPFVFDDNRELYVQSKQAEDVDVLFMNDEIYYTAQPVLKHLGYKTSLGKNGLYVQNNTDKYRFPLKYGFYMYNNKRYNTVSEPIIKIGGELYIEETWLVKLFNIDINKKEKSISLKKLEVE